MLSQASVAWNLISDEQVFARRGVLKEKDVLQLKSIFLTLDDDNDGLLSIDQLAVALKLLGIHPREELLQKFQMPLAASSQSNRSIRTSFTYQPQTDFNTFVSVLGRERVQLQGVKDELDNFFEFLDPNNTGSIKKSELRHYLVDMTSPMSMSPLEFNRFLKSIHITTEDETISIKLLKRHIIFGTGKG